MGSLLDWLVDHEPVFRKSRLPSLYSDLAVQKTTNPEGYTANVAAWQAALNRAALSGRLPDGQHLIVNSSEELLEALSSSQYGRPAGLGLVFDDAVRGGKMFDVGEFFKVENSIYDQSWALKPMVILKWTLKQAGLTGTSSYDISGRLKSGQLVLLPALEHLAKNVVSLQQKKGIRLVDRLLTRDSFAQQLNELIGAEVTDQEMEVALRYLSRDKHILTYDDQVIKFHEHPASVPEPITTSDITIASMKALRSSLERQSRALNEKIAELQASALSAIKNKNKVSALASLRSKKLAEKTLQQRMDTLHQVEEVYTRIEDAVDQAQLVNAMESSAKVLKDLNKKIGGVERVESVMDVLREEMDQAHEVGQIINEPLNSQAVVDEGEIDEEFENLENEQKEIQRQQETELTKARLQELEAVETKQREQEKNLKASVEALEQMTLDDSNTGPERSGVVTERA